MATIFRLSYWAPAHIYAQYFHPLFWWNYAIQTATFHANSIIILASDVLFNFTVFMHFSSLNPAMMPFSNEYLQTSSGNVCYNRTIFLQLFSTNSHWKKRKFSYGWKDFSIDGCISRFPSVFVIHEFFPTKNLLASVFLDYSDEFHIKILIFSYFLSNFRWVIKIHPVKLHASRIRRSGV